VEIALQKLLRAFAFALAIGGAHNAAAQERLAMPAFPSGWVEAFARQGEQQLVEYVPPGQTATKWQRKITVEVYRDFKNLPLDTFQRRAAAQNRSICTGVREGGFQSGVNNGYASAFWTLGCERDKVTGYGETRYTKAIQGDEALYLLTQIWRTPAFNRQGPSIPAAELEDAMAFLTSSVLCDGAQHPCPAPQ
jgi:hypothetical protein